MTDRVNSVTTTSVEPIPDKLIKDIQIAQLELAKDVAINLVRDCPDNIKKCIQDCFVDSIEKIAT